MFCLNVPVARSGTQEYLPEELGRPPGPDSLAVERPESEVFAPATIASFEGMPVTDDHPDGDDGVTAENIRYLQKGHAHNVRRGTGAESDLLLADLIITDTALIEAILGGKREISCGYTYDLCEENGHLIQRNIRGNHVAVVDAGRAGHRVRIRDNKPIQFERSNKMNKKLSRMLARMAKDGDIEEVAELIEELIEPETVEMPTPMVTAPLTPVVAYPALAPEVAEALSPEAEENAHDDDVMLEILQRLDQLITLLTPAADCGNNPESNQDEDPEEEISEVVEEVLEAVGLSEEPAADPEEIAEVIEAALDPESTVLEPDETLDEDPDEDDPNAYRAATADALRSALTAFRPAIAKMTKAQKATFYDTLRKKTADRAARKKASDRSGVYSALARVSAGRRESDPAELGKRIMASRNANFKSMHNL